MRTYTPNEIDQLEREIRRSVAFIRSHYPMFSCQAVFSGYESDDVGCTVSWLPDQGQFAIEGMPSEDDVQTSVPLNDYQLLALVPVLLSGEVSVIKAGDPRVSPYVGLS